MWKEWNNRWRKYWDRIDVWESCHAFSGVLWLLVGLFALVAVAFLLLPPLRAFFWPSWCNWLFLVLGLALIRLAIYSTKP